VYIQVAPQIILSLKAQYMHYTDGIYFKEIFYKYAVQMRKEYSTYSTYQQGQR